LADGPFAYWRLGETSGTKAVDSSGNGHSGTYVGGVTLGLPGALFGDPNPAVRFDGVSGSVQVSDTAALRLNGSWSIEFWARQVSFANTSPGIIGKGSSATANGYTIYASSNGTLWFKRNNRQAGSGSGALTSSFRYFVVTYDRARLRWYVDGSLATTSSITFPGNNGTPYFQIGNGDEYGNNDIDEVALYSTSLSAAQIAAHYAAGS
jgi:hypothetical protein